MRLQFYKLRAIIMLYAVKVLAKILFLETLPIFSVSGLISRGDTLLFMNLSYSKGLGLLGGHVNGGETLEKALHREIFEETGLSITHMKYFTSTASTYHGFPKVDVVFMIETTGNLKSSEEGKLVWMKPQDALGKMFYPDGDKTIKKFLQAHGQIG